MDNIEEEEEIERPREPVEPAVAELLPRFFQILARDVEHLGDALARWDVERLGRLGHGLKGSGTSFGFPEITRLGEKVEDAARAHNEAALRTAVAALIRYGKRVLDENPIGSP